MAKFLFTLVSLLIFFVLLKVDAHSHRNHHKHHKHHKHHNHHKHDRFKWDDEDDDSVSNYYHTQELPDGVRITWAALNGILAKEQRTTHENEQWTVSVRSITDGRSLVISIFDGSGAAIDCDIQMDSESLNRFIDEFRLGVPLPFTASKDSNNKNKTVIFHRKKDIPNYIKDLLDFKEQRRGCKALHELFKKAAGSKWQSTIQRPETIAEMAKRTTDTKRRSKRSAESLMYPGTNWCGRGSIAKHYNDLGSNIDTDKCCRSHDHCPYTIQSFQNKYGLFNYRFGTLSHCECDFSFRTCLKTANTEVAHMVGNIFFDIYRTNCFTFIPKKVCAERSWWSMGKCIKFKYQYEAELHKPVEYA